MDGIAVHRAPVKRNRAGYVRGYFSYLSFDIPLFFRLLAARKADLLFVEPPPTTGSIVRIVSWLRRIPYVYNAADLWSDAAVTTTRSRLVLRALRAAERFAIRGAIHAFVVASVYAERLRELGIQTPTTVAGFGADTATFEFQPSHRATPAEFIYAGSYSEWHGAEVFIRAVARLVDEHPDVRLSFIGNGSEQLRLAHLAEELGVDSNVDFTTPIPGAQLAIRLRGAAASLASLTPGGYDYAFATKIYSSLAVGCPVIFSGSGPTGPFIEDAAKTVSAGIRVEYDAAKVAAAMSELIENPVGDEERRGISDWIRTHHSLRGVAEQIVSVSSRIVRQ